MSTYKTKEYKLSQFLHMASCRREYSLRKSVDMLQTNLSIVKLENTLQSSLKQRFISKLALNTSRVLQKT